uniref:ADIPOR-like receptor CG5315 n=1 Tax=Caligus clemensi TaxID=344056 RepID=C1C1T2_CALCM|nr:ADIPOR-like receptor CG5315 [Caligus clemensi]
MMSDLEEIKPLPEVPSAIPRRLRRHVRSSSSPPVSSFMMSSPHRKKSDFPQEEEDLELLPPLEPLLVVGFQMEDDSLAPSLENDVFPSTPLNEEELIKQDHDMDTCLPLNHIPSDEGDEMDWKYDLKGMMLNAAEQAEEFAISIWHKLQSWKVTHFSNLPQWLQDNDFLHFGHRPPLPTLECFKSIFRIHTETGNIWTHLLGVVAFIGLAAYILARPLTEIQHVEKGVFACFFLGAIVCMGMSFTYHMLCCHENRAVGRLFAKFDYCGIAFLTVGSFVPWLYYSFYCDVKLQMIYLFIVVILGIGAVVVSTFDFFAGPRFRPLRAGVFIFFGLSGIAPATHYGIVNGWEKAVYEAALGWLILMGILYITGALLYAMRIPERFFPGKVDIWFHSHQIFHCFVMGGAFVHYHGISLMATRRLLMGECPTKPLDDCYLKYEL